MESEAINFPRKLTQDMGVMTCVISPAGSRIEVSGVEKTSKGVLNFT